MIMYSCTLEYAYYLVVCIPHIAFPKSRRKPSRRLTTDDSRLDNDDDDDSKKIQFHLYYSRVAS